MRSIIAIFFAVFFFLPAAKGQGEIFGVVKNKKSAYDSIKTKTILDLALNQERNCQYPGKSQLLIGVNRADKTVYLLDGVLDDKDLAIEFAPQTWLNTNTLLTKIYTEKNFQYTNLEYFISTLPQLQR